jgi:hypothetical protein
LHSGQLVLEKNLEKSGFPVYWISTKLDEIPSPGRYPGDCPPDWILMDESMNFLKGAKVQIQAKRPGVRGRPEDGGKVTYIRAANPGVDICRGSSQQAPGSSPVGTRWYFACHQLLCCCTVLVKCAAVEFSPDLFLARSTAITWIHLSGFRELYSSCHLLIVLFVYSRSGIRS